MRKKRVRVISGIAAAFLIVSGFALKEYSRAARFEQLLESNYTHAFYELTGAVSELDTALQKAQYAATPVMLSVLCTDIYGKAVCAQMALGELPNSDTLLEQTSAFLARTGDYAFSASRASISKTNDLSAVHTTLHALGTASSALSAALLDIQSDLSGGSISIDRLLHAEEILARHTKDGQAAQGGTSFQNMEADFPETPALIYDGPFSEHLSNRTPRALEGLSMVSRDEARAAAADFLGLYPGVLRPADAGGGVLPVWCFTAAVDGGEIYIEVTQQGCKVLSLLSSSVITDSSLSVQQARAIAKTFLARQGYENMAESYYINYGNVLLVNYAPVDNGVICYPDLIKVSVALDSGRVIGFESHGWVMNHTSRSFPAAAISVDTARTVVSPDLEILSHQMALIPTGGQYEVLCHEFKCRTPQDTHIIVYVNAATGNEEQILLLLEDENGTLVW